MDKPEIPQDRWPGKLRLHEGFYLFERPEQPLFCIQAMADGHLNYREDQGGIYFIEQDFIDFFYAHLTGVHTIERLAEAPAMYNLWSRWADVHQEKAEELKPVIMPPGQAFRFLNDFDSDAYKAEALVEQIEDMEDDELIDALKRVDLDYLPPRYLFHKKTISLLRGLKEDAPGDFMEIKVQIPGDMLNDLHNYL